MELNLKYYNGKDTYSDGDIENTIIKYLKKYDNYEDALIKDSSWPVFYHLSNMRKNVISWYPFEKDASILEVGAGMGALTGTLCDKCKSVTSIELSKRRATAILERNKSRKNLEIVVGNFKDIKITKKFDYILLCGVLEYGALYMDSNNPYIDFLNKLKSYLKPNGKILIAIENRLGLKYLCGANEDHSDIPFDGLNGYPSNNGIRTFSKDELDMLAKDVNMSVNYYYMFPDYKFPQIILTDEGLNKVRDFSYIPYYCKNMDLVINEQKLFEDLKNNNLIPTFANSYFLELSKEKCKKEIEYVKFNFYRKNEYNLNTYLKDNRFYKVANNKEAKSQIDNLISISKLLENNKIDYLKNYIEDDKIYTKNTTLSTLQNLLDDYLKENNIDKIYEVYDNLYNYLKQILGEEIKPEKTIFDKYNVKITKSQKEKLHFYKNGFIDIIPSNILVDKDKYILFDQEWYEENVPIEYLMFRTIRNSLESKCDYKNSFNELLSKYNVNISLLEQLDNVYLNSIYSNDYLNVFLKMRGYRLVNPSKIAYDNSVLINENNKLINLNNELESKNTQLTNKLINVQNNYDITKTRLDEIENSKGFKLLNKFYKLKGKIRKKK